MTLEIREYVYAIKKLVKSAIRDIDINDEKKYQTDLKMIHIELAHLKRVNSFPHNDPFNTSLIQCLEEKAEYLVQLLEGLV